MFFQYEGVPWCDYIFDKMGAESLTMQVCANLCSHPVGVCEFVQSSLQVFANLCSHHRRCVRICAVITTGVCEFVQSSLQLCANL